MNKTDNIPKKTYTKPVLKKHGLVKDLVKGSLSIGTDQGGGFRNPNPRT